MTRNHRNYPYYHAASGHQNISGEYKNETWKYNFKNSPKQKNVPRQKRGSIDIVKLLSALGINDPRINMLLGFFNGSNKNIMQMLNLFIGK